MATGIHAPRGAAALLLIISNVMSPFTHLLQRLKPVRSGAGSQVRLLDALPAVQLCMPACCWRHAPLACWTTWQHEPCMQRM